jgi:hypothetical protein
VKSLDKILKGFHKTIEQLDSLIVHNEAAVDANMEQIERLREENLDLTAEKQSAANIRNNLQKLLEG